MINEYTKCYYYASVATKIFFYTTCYSIFVCTPRAKAPQLEFLH